MDNLNQKTQTPKNINTLFTKDFYVSESLYYQITIINGKLNFAQKTFPQICNLLAKETDKGIINMPEQEKEIFKHYLDTKKQIDLTNLVINYVYTFSEIPPEPYILDLRENKATVFIGTTLKNKIQDNTIWESYLGDRFGIYKAYAKRWISAYCYFSEHEYKHGTINKRLPVKILIGERSTGKTSYIELLSKIFGQNNYAKFNKEVFVGRFDDWKSNKLGHLNESSKLNHSQYEKIKEIQGSSILQVERKGKDRFKIKNNFSLIVDSNKKNPIYTVLAEMPTNESENQFFVTEFKELPEKNDKVLMDLENSFYHYIKTELWEVWQNEVVPFINTNRWIIPTPITEECQNMFMINKTNTEHAIEEITTILKNDYLDKKLTYITNPQLEDLAFRLNAKKSSYLINDLVENGLLFPKSRVQSINGKKIRVYDINMETVNKLHSGNLPEDLFFDTYKEQDNNIFPIAGIN